MYYLATLVIVQLAQLSLAAGAIHNACPADPREIMISPGVCMEQPSYSGNCFCRPSVTDASASVSAPLVSNVPLTCDHLRLCDCPVDGLGALKPDAFVGPGVGRIVKLILNDCGITSLKHEHSLRGFASLTSLHLDANALSESSIATDAIYSATPRLQSLHLSANNFHQLPNIRLPKHLTRLGLASNPLTDCSLPDAVASTADSLLSITLSSSLQLRQINSNCLPNKIQALTCRSCPLEKLELASVADSLISLHLSLPPKSGAKSASSAAAGDLPESHLNFNAALTATKNLRALSTLSLQRFSRHAVLTSQDLSSVTWTSTMAMLEIANIDKLHLLCHSNGEVSRGCFSALIELKHLNLENCGLDENSIGCLSPLPTKLQKLVLAGNRLNKIPSDLPISLEILNLDSNQLTELQPERLVHLTKLKEFSLLDNHLVTPAICLCLPSSTLVRMDGQNKAALQGRQTISGCSCAGSDVASSGVARGANWAPTFGGVVGALVLVAAIGLFSLLLFKKRRRHSGGHSDVELADQHRHTGGRYHSNNHYVDVNANNNNNNNNDQQDGSSLGSDAQLNNQRYRRNDYGMPSEAVPLRTLPPTPPPPSNRNEADDLQLPNNAAADDNEGQYSDLNEPSDQQQYLLICCDRDSRDYFSTTWSSRTNSGKFLLASDRAALHNAQSMNWRRILIVLSDGLLQLEDMKNLLKRLIKNDNRRRRRNDDSSPAIMVTIAPGTVDNEEFGARIRAFCNELNDLRHSSSHFVAWSNEPTDLIRSIEAAVA